MFWPLDLETKGQKMYFYMFLFDFLVVDDLSWCSAGAQLVWRGFDMLRVFRQWKNLTIFLLFDENGVEIFWPLDLETKALVTHTYDSDADGYVKSELHEEATEKENNPESIRYKGRKEVPKVRHESTQTWE